MSNVPHKPDDESDPQLPSELRADLASLYRSPIAVPSRLDDAIRNRAHAKLAGTNRWNARAALRWAGAAVAAAACLALVGRTIFQTPLAPNDIDGNRRVDIVDALRLAHQLQSGSGRDINHDGVVDSRDVDSIAMGVVTLDLPGGVQ